jgi:hypothetical protein
MGRPGGVAERLNAAVSKTVSGEIPPTRVRIPPPPFFGGKIIAGFAAFKDHLSYLPFSGSVLGQLRDELDGYAMTKSSLHFPIDRPLPDVGRRVR